MWLVAFIVIGAFAAWLVRLFMRGGGFGLAGDVIVGVNATEVSSTRQLNDELTKAADRSSFVLDVAHGGVIYGLTFPMGI